MGWTHLLFILAVVAFGNTILTDPGRVPAYWVIVSIEWNEFKSSKGIFLR